MSGPGLSGWRYWYGGITSPQDSSINRCLRGGLLRPLSSRQRPAGTRVPEEGQGDLKRRGGWRDLPGGPVVMTVFPMQRASVPSLVRELRSHMPCGVAKLKKKSNNKKKDGRLALLMCHPSRPRVRFGPRSEVIHSFLVGSGGG